MAGGCLASADFPPLLKFPDWSLNCPPPGSCIPVRPAARPTATPTDPMSTPADNDSVTSSEAPRKAATSPPQDKPWQEKKRPAPSHIVFYNYPKFLYTWPVIVLAALFPLLGEWLNPQVEGWIFLITLLTVLMAIGFDPG